VFRNNEHSDVVEFVRLLARREPQSHKLSPYSTGHRRCLKCTESETSIVVSWTPNSQDTPPRPLPWERLSSRSKKVGLALGLGRVMFVRFRTGFMVAFKTYSRLGVWIGFELYLRLRLDMEFKSDVRLGLNLLLGLWLGF
jgi:hypothetical protein